MKKLLLSFLLLFPIYSFASGYAVKDAWRSNKFKTNWVLVIEVDDQGKEIRRYGFWDTIVTDRYFVKYQRWDEHNEEEMVIKEVDKDTWTGCVECGYYIGD